MKNKIVSDVKKRKKENWIIKYLENTKKINKLRKTST